MPPRSAPVPRHPTATGRTRRKWRVLPATDQTRRRVSPGCATPGRWLGPPLPEQRLRTGQPGVRSVHVPVTELASRHHLRHFILSWPLYLGPWPEPGRISAMVIAGRPPMVIDELGHAVE